MSGWVEVKNQQRKQQQKERRRKNQRIIMRILREIFFLYHSISTRFSFLCVLFKYLDDDDNLSHSAYPLPLQFLFISMSIYFCLKNLLAFVWQKLNKNPLSTHSLTRSMISAALQRKIENFLSCVHFYGMPQLISSHSNYG
jgi:hypothetical protein